MPRKNIIHTNEYRGYTLAPEEHFYETKYLKKGIEMINSMEKRHSKVLQVRMDFRYPSNTQSNGANDDFSKTLQNFTKELSRKNCDPQYIARREQEKSHNPHLHLNLIVNGNKRRSAKTLIESAEKHWANTLGISQAEVHANKLVYPCNHDADGNYRPNSYMLERRKMDDTKEKMIQQMAYLTKIKETDITPSSTRKFFTSQFQKDYETAEVKKAKWLHEHGYYN